MGWCRSVFVSYRYIYLLIEMSEKFDIFVPNYSHDANEC